MQNTNYKDLTTEELIAKLSAWSSKANATANPQERGDHERIIAEIKTEIARRQRAAAKPQSEKPHVSCVQAWRRSGDAWAHRVPGQITLTDLGVLYKSSAV
jgi:hypothetical protein